MKPRMFIIGVLHERILCGIRNIAHTIRKAINDIQRFPAQLSSSIVFELAICALITLLAVCIHRPVDDPGALLIRAVNGMPIEVLNPRHLRLRFRLLDRGHRFSVDNVLDGFGERPL